MPTSSELAQSHWNETPLYYTEDYRYSLYPWLYEAAEFRHHAGERVLEIGCGTGSDLLQFAKNGAVATGIDITDEHLRLAKDRVGDLAEVKRGDATNIPFPDANFDYVYSHGVIHHIDRPQRAVTEILRVLKPGGRFNIHVYSRYSYFTAWLLLRYQRKWKRYIENSTAPVHIDLYTARSLRKLFPVPLEIRKYQCPWQTMAFLFGWYLVAKGRKPGSDH